MEVNEPKGPKIRASPAEVTKWKVLKSEKNNSLDQLIDDIARGRFRKIVVFTGAGVSTSSGLPDYRSSSGLYSTGWTMEDFSDREKWKRIRPLMLEKMEKVEPCAAHHFCAWLHTQGFLDTIFTQNIDGLHQKAGVPDDKVVECHGSLARDNVVLYGESLPEEFKEKAMEAMTRKPDLALCLGTTLLVMPFAALPNLVPREAVRVWITGDLTTLQQDARASQLSASTTFYGTASEPMMRRSAVPALRLGAGCLLSCKNRWWETGDHPHFISQWCIDCRDLCAFVQLVMQRAEDLQSGKLSFSLVDYLGHSSSVWAGLSLTQWLEEDQKNQNFVRDHLRQFVVTRHSQLSVVWCDIHCASFQKFDAQKSPFTLSEVIDCVARTVRMINRESQEWRSDHFFRDNQVVLSPSSPCPLLDIRIKHIHFDLVTHQINFQ